MVQPAPAATLLPHVLVSEKLSLSVPVIEIAVMVTATLDLLLKVIFLAALLVPTV